MLRKISLFLFISAVMLLAAAGAVPPQESGRAYDAVRTEAERHYAEKSFGRARALYEQAAKLSLEDEEKRWVAFRLADTQWRVDAASPDDDPTNRENARKELEEIIKLRDWIGAEANESLGDLWATHPRQQNPYGAQQYYNAALDWWAGSDDIPRARRRYLAIAWRIADHPHQNILSREVLVNVIQIAETPQDRARAQFLLATQYVNQRSPANLERGFELLEAVVNQGKKTAWYDDALYLWASNLPDYPKALQLYRRLLAEHTQAESEWVDDAQRAIEEITTTSVQVGAAQTFLPDSEQEILIAWRNTKQIELTLYAIDLTRDLRWDNSGEWTKTISTADKKVVRRWSYDTNDRGDYRPGHTTIHVEPRLPLGAYLLTGTSGKTSSRALFLVTDAHILLHSAGGRTQVFVSNVETGEPIAGATVRVVNVQGLKPSEVLTKTNADGLADVSVKDDGSILVTASAGARQAYHNSTWMQGSARPSDRAWRIYAFTDRPAYRPEETVQWKILARVRDDERWQTPANDSLTYEILSPRNEKVAGGTAKLNAFGSFWSDLALTSSMALGQYTIRFQQPGNAYVAQVPLFRLEEYKLPEFTVSVSTPENALYRLGDTIEATVEANYYFGGPVANAEVEAVVYQQPFVRYWYPWRVYDWYWPDWQRPQSEQVMTRQMLRTDANGRAVVRIETNRDGSNMTYRIEARVVDASRREVRGEGIVRATQQRYSVMVWPEHYLHRPAERINVKFKAIDANDKPVRTTGTVVVTQRRWKQRAYIEDTVLTTKLDTNAAGEATLTFTPKDAGYYAVRWTSSDGDGKKARDVVSAETTVWVADPATTDIGYYYMGGIDLIIDKESMRAGETANVLVVTPASGRWVVLTASGDSILDTRVLHLDGTVKLVQIPLDDRFTPNFFLTASTIFNRQLSTGTKGVIVPPVEHFLDVEVKADREQYEPRQEGTLTITTRDVDGKPVPAEVAVSLSDEAVTAIGQDLAGDPRQFFFGALRSQQVQVTAGLYSQQYRKLDEKDVAAVDDERKRYDAYGQERGVASGVVGGVAEMPAGRDFVAAQTVTSYAPVVAPAPPPMAKADMALRKEEANQSAEAPPIDVQVRSDFRSTALWKPDVLTDANGRATISVKFPEALTTWRATARAATTGSSFGIGTSTTRTNLPLLVRLQAPRFFVVGDRATVSAVVNNNTDSAITITPALDIEGAALKILTSPAEQTLRVDAHAEARADWVVNAASAGNVKLRVTARNAQLGDAMEKPFVVYEHGVDKLIAKSGKMRGDETTIRLELPRERRATDLTIQIAPSLATTMLDALPYLVEFPYGCTEQTMSRFLPAVIVARTLEKLGLDPNERLPKKKLDAVTTAGMKRLYDMQHGDGGWGWWKDGSSDDFMTAYVVWGFSLAREAGLQVNASAIDRAAAWLTTRLVENRTQWHEQTWMLHAISAWRNAKPSTAEREAFDDVWVHRDRLTAYSRALLALTAHRYGETERTAILLRNLEDGVQLDRATGDDAEAMATAHWGSSQNFWWRWYEGPVETTAFVLRALVTIDPKHRLVEPTMNWLVKNRRGAQWHNTRDTAVALLALNDYLVQSGELRGDVSYELTVNGRVVASKKLTAADVVRAPSRFPIDAALLKDTTQEIRIRRTSGTAPLYFSAEGRFVSLEEPVKAAGNELFVRRDYYRLKPRLTLLKGVLYDNVLLRDGESIKSGERLEVVVTVDAKNDYSYLLFEDLKPAGFEAVALQSGQPLWATQAKTKASVYVYQELRDRKVAMFIDHLQQGVWEIRYTLRAETPGSFHALPLMGQAMYVPDVRANGDEVRVVVEERAN